MPDIFTKEKRSEVMSRIRPKNTKPEMLVFRELRRRGIYFQKHYKRVAGSPDIALPRKKIAVFIDGDFWHGYRFDSYKDRLPKEYWLGKIEANIKRDKRDRMILKRAGWKVMRVWEHDLSRNKIKKTIDKVLYFLNKDI